MTDRQGTNNPIAVAESCCQKTLPGSIAVTDLWEFEQTTSHYRYRIFPDPTPLPPHVLLCSDQTSGPYLVSGCAWCLNALQKEDISSMHQDHKMKMWVPSMSFGWCVYVYMCLEGSGKVGLPNLSLTALCDFIEGTAGLELTLGLQIRDGFHLFSKVAAWHLIKCLQNICSKNLINKKPGIVEKERGNPEFTVDHARVMKWSILIGQMSPLELGHYLSQAQPMNEIRRCHQFSFFLSQGGSYSRHRYQDGPKTWTIHLLKDGKTWTTKQLNSVSMYTLHLCVPTGA